MIKLLDQNEREVLRPVFEKVFDSDLPDERQANIAAVVENGCIAAFLTTEVVLRTGLIWTHPKIRGRKGAKAVIELAQYVKANIPEGASVLAIASEERFGKLFEKFGMRKIEGTVYRIDL